MLISKASYLDSYEKGVTTSKTALIDIARQLNDSKAEQVQLATLRRLVGAKLDELSKTVELERTNRHSEAIAIVQSDFGKDLMDQTQLINGRVLDDERLRLGENSSAIQARRLLTGRLFRAVIIAIALLFTNTAFLVRRSLIAQRTAIEAIQLNEAKLCLKKNTCVLHHH